MSSTIEEIEDKILNLPIDDRARLIRQVLDSLEEIEADPEVDQAWLDIAEERYQEYKKGSLVTVSQEVVISNLRKEISPASES